MANAQVAALLPPGLHRAQTAPAPQTRSGLPETLINTDKNNFSPRVGFAWRLDENNKTVLRGGFGLFHPTVAVQGIRDLLATNEFRFVNTTHAAADCATASPAARRRRTSRPSATRASTPNLQSPDIYQYNLTLERELPGDIGLRASYIGSTMRKLLVDRDYNTLPASTVPFDPANPADYARLPFPFYGYYMDIVSNAGSGQFHSAQLELLRRWRSGLAFNVAYTLADSDSNAPDTGNSTIGPVQFDPYDIEKDRGPDPNVVKHRVVANATWDIPVGRGRPHGANMAKLGGRAVRRLDGLDDLPGAQRPEPDAVLQRLLHDQPVEYRQAARRPGQLLLLRLAARPDRRSQQRRLARCVLQPGRVCDPRTGTARQREERAA